MILIWLFNCALYSVKIRGSTLLIEFFDWQSLNSGYDLFIPIGSIYFIISFILLLMATNWTYSRYLIRTTTLILFTSAIVSIAIRTKFVNNREVEFVGLGVLSICTTSLQAFALLLHLWNYVFVPKVIKWKWSNIIESRRIAKTIKINSNMAGASSSHSTTCDSIKMMLFITICFPMWIPIVFFIAIDTLMGTGCVRFDVFYRLDFNHWTFSYVGNRVYYNPRPCFFRHICNCSVSTLCSNYFWCKKPPVFFFQYYGGCDSLGRPHGFGRWLDSDPTGEVFALQKLYPSN